MSAVIVVLHVVVCIFLIAVILLQRGRGAEVGAVFGGGGSSTVFGSRGAGNFLTKLTTGSAIVFMGTSLMLSYLNTGGSGDRLFEDGVDDQPAVEQPIFEELGTVPADETTPLPDAPATAASEPEPGSAPNP